MTEKVLVLTTDGVLTALRGAIDAQRPDTLDNSEFFVTSNVMRLYKNLLQARDNSVAQSDIVDGRPVYYFEGYKINELFDLSSASPPLNDFHYPCVSLAISPVSG